MTKNTRFIFATLSALLILILTAVPIYAQNPTPTPAPAGPTLKSLRSRNLLVCGINQDQIGLGYLDPNSGDVVGLQVDLCRALAAAIFGDAAAVEFPPYSTTDAAVAALKSGAADLIIQNTPWTLTADTSGFEFGPPIFYSGEGIMVRADGGAKTWTDLNRKAVCVVKNSIAEAQIVKYAAEQKTTIQLISPAFDTLQDAWQALRDGRCDALSAERLQLLILRKRASDSQSYFVWDGPNDVYTHEPYAPMLRNDDEQWANIVRWTMLGLVKAEQLGITSETVDSLLRQVDPKTNTPEPDADYIARVGAERAHFLDPLLGLGSSLGIAPDFMRPAIIAVGNYGEIYARHFGANADLPLARGLNNLASKDGLMYAPDWR
ncbi:MAG: transporter substrate-binding domain-containing protein [Anaerolineaceae bacterium]|nr:transporter substrate-binding domain-containing protein [Anaerolineaceae bacterium]